MIKNPTEWLQQEKLSILHSLIGKILLYSRSNTSKNDFSSFLAYILGHKFVINQVVNSFLNYNYSIYYFFSRDGKQALYHIISQNHRMVEVGSKFWGSLRPSSLLTARSPRTSCSGPWPVRFTVFPWLEGSTTSLGNLFLCFTLSKTGFFLCLY